jgi:hypothetical protein
MSPLGPARRDIGLEELRIKKHRLASVYQRRVVRDLNNVLTS